MVTVPAFTPVTVAVPVVAYQFEEDEVFSTVAFFEVLLFQLWL